MGIADFVPQDILESLKRHARSNGWRAAASFEFKQVLGLVPAFSFFTNEVFDRHANVVEEHLVNFMIAAKSNDRSNRNTR